MKRKKICIFSGTRADYGHLYWIIKNINDDPDLILQLLVSGSHLEQDFGETWKVIENDGFIIDKKVKMIQPEDDPLSIAASMSAAITGYSEAFQKLEPKIIVILGDRYEALAAALAATILNIPVAHIHGGELTDGALDNAFRHAITKLAHIHFTATAEYRQRVIQMGEQPNLVFNLGAPGLDYVENFIGMDPSLFESKTNFKLAKTNFLVTFHPVTLGHPDNIKSINNLIEALEEFPEAHILITKSNADSDGLKINSVIEAYAQDHPNRISIHASLGQCLFFTALSIMDVIIGNSSSGIIEAPALGIPTVNIGPRQHGRSRAPSIIDCEDSTEEITQGIKKSLAPSFKKMCQQRQTPYLVNNASSKIVEKLKSLSFEDLLLKRFSDIN